MTRRLAAAALLFPLLAAGCCRPCAPRCGDPCADAGPAAAPMPMPVPTSILTRATPPPADGYPLVMSHAPTVELNGDPEPVLSGEPPPPAVRLKYFDVKDLLDAHPTIVDDLRPLLGSVEGRTIDLKNGTLIVRAPREVLDAVTARLEALRAAK